MIVPPLDLISRATYMTESIKKESGQTRNRSSWLSKFSKVTLANYFSLTALIMIVFKATNLEIFKQQK